MAALEPTPTPAAPQRPLRAHAQRNRDKLVAVARTAFAASDDSVPLETIAREAGVGIGTLYRHFPTREALVEAVYAAELDELSACVPDLLERLPPLLALRAWMERYAAFAVMKHGMADAIRAGQTAGRIPTTTTRERITAAITAFLTAGAATGALRADVEPEQVTMMILGIFLATAALDTPEQIGRLLDLLVDALHPQPAP